MITLRCCPFPRARSILMLLALLLATTPANGQFWKKWGKDDKEQQEQADDASGADKQDGQDKPAGDSQEDETKKAGEQEDKKGGFLKKGWNKFKGVFKGDKDNGGAGEQAQADTAAGETAEEDEFGLDTMPEPESEQGRRLKGDLSKQNRRLRQYESEVERSLAEGDTSRAMKYMILYGEMRDSLQATKAQMEAEEVRHHLKMAEARQREQRQQIIIYSVSGGGVLLLGLAGTLLVAFRQKRRSNLALQEKNEQLNQAYEEISTQQEALDRQHQDILDSIHYASRIQRAIMPTGKLLTQHFDESFVLYKPRDVVSGDFYWYHREPDGRLIVAAVDCTGHGVPGAFMSVLGMSLLDQIVHETEGQTPGAILDQLHAEVIRSLSQEGKGHVQHDGMDLSMVAISPDRRELEFAGAKNPLYILRKGGDEIEQHKGDKAAIGGGYDGAHQFSTTRLSTVPGDALFLFSDGLPDQFGGPRGRKYTYKRMRQQFVQARDASLRQVGSMLERDLDEWMGDQVQLDDILVIGLRL